MRGLKLKPPGSDRSRPHCTTPALSGSEGASKYTSFYLENFANTIEIETSWG